MIIHSYYWPTHHPSDGERWDMDTVTSVDILPSHAGAQIKDVWRAKGKTILHRVYVKQQPVSRLCAVMSEAMDGHVDGIALDEFLLGGYTGRGVKMIDGQLRRFRDRYPGAVVLAWVGCALSKKDEPLMGILVERCSYVVPELYVDEDKRVRFNAFLRRYAGVGGLREKTIIGISLKEELSKRTDDGWMRHIRKQVLRAGALGVAGVAFFAPCHLTRENRVRVDAMVKRDLG